MKMNKLVLAMTLLMGAGSSYAGFVDNRAADGVVEVNYKAIALEDLVGELAPPEYMTEYAKPLQGKTLVSITGKGTWSMLLADAVAKSNLSVSIDQVNHRIKFADRAVAVAVVAAPAATTGAAAQAPIRTTNAVVQAAAPAPAVAIKPATLKVQAPVATPAPLAFTTTSGDFQVSAVLQRWANQANMQFVWEPRNVEFQVSAENDWGTDLRQAVRGLLTSAQMNQSSQAGRERVRACIHPNKPKNVLRIIRFEERCQGDM